MIHKYIKGGPIHFFYFNAAQHLYAFREKYQPCLLDNKNYFFWYLKYYLKGYSAIRQRDFVPLLRITDCLNMKHVSARNYFMKP